MAERKQRSIGRILIEKGIVTEEQVAHALEMQRENPKIRLGEALVQMQAANWDQVYEALAELLGYRFVDLRATRIPAEAIEAMPKVHRPKAQPRPGRRGRWRARRGHHRPLRPLRDGQPALLPQPRGPLRAGRARRGRGSHQQVLRHRGIHRGQHARGVHGERPGHPDRHRGRAGGRRGFRHDPPGDAAHQRGGEDARERHPHRADEDQTARAVPRGRQLPGNGFPAEETARADHLAREDPGGD